MDRRAFLKTSTAAAAASLPWRGAFAAADWRTYEITTRVELQWPKGVSRAWIPLPLIGEYDWQRTLASTWSSNAARTQALGDGKHGVTMVYAEWRDAAVNPVLEVTSRVMTRERNADLSKLDASLPDLAAADRAFFTAPSDLIPTDGIVRATAAKIVKSAKSDVEKAKAIYEWVVDNTFRDAKVRGCGWGDIKAMLESGNLGGKCGDLNALFVGLARSAGIPARDVYGLRVGISDYGYRSMGIGNPNATRAQHCRAEFFARGHGWVGVDPADVRKVVLEEPPANLPLTDPKVLAARKRLFGGWEMNWLAYNMGHDVKLPNSSGAKLPYLMYVNAEAGGEMLDQLDPDAVKYTIVAREIKA
jgi:transglutaminase-like putative cysteine protease